jgi:hypothetical protein
MRWARSWRTLGRRWTPTATIGAAVRQATLGAALATAIDER